MKKNSSKKYLLKSPHVCPPYLDFVNWPGSSPLPALPSHLIKKSNPYGQTDGQPEGQPDYIMPPTAGSRRHKNTADCVRQQ